MHIQVMILVSFVTAANTYEYSFWTIEDDDIIVDHKRPPPYPTDDKMTFYLATSSSVWDDRKDLYGPKNLYDGAMRSDFYYDGGACFSTVAGQKSWAQLDSYDYMAIREIHLLSIFVDKAVNGEGVANWKDIKGLEVKVCQNSTRKDCKLFGTVETPIEGGWIVVRSKKDMDLKGATILLEHDTAIQICEIIVKGGKFSGTEMKFYNAQSSGVFGPAKMNGPQNLFDGDLRTNWRHGGCFLSEDVNGDGNKNEATVKLETTEGMYISEIYILNIFSDLQREYEQTNGLHVGICGNRSIPHTKNDHRVDCEFFGTVTDAPNGGWIRIARNIKVAWEEAIAVLLKHTRSIRICELRVVGTTLPRHETRMTFYHSDRSPYLPYSGSRPYRLYDGNMHNYHTYGGCFYGERTLNPDTNEAWVAVYSKDAYYITNIYLLNAIEIERSQIMYNLDERIEGMRVEVCANSTKTDCALFGTVKDAPIGGWIKLSRKTAMRLEGETTIVLKHNNPIRLCELIAEAKKVPKCTECTQEIVKRGEEFVCGARIEVSPFVAAGQCECECGEGEQLETRTCSLFENKEGTCVEKIFDSVPQDPTHACAQFQLNRTVRCDDQCNKIQEWVDEYVDVDECEPSADYFCGSCGNQLQLKKCKAFVKTYSECRVIETADPSLCGSDQPRRTIPCTLSQPTPCKISRVTAYMWTDPSPTVTKEEFFSFWAYKLSNTEATGYFYGSCRLGTFSLPLYKDDASVENTERQTIAVASVDEECSDLCLDRKGVRMLSTKCWRYEFFKGNLSIEVNGVLMEFGNPKEDPNWGKTYFYRVE